MAIAWGMYREQIRRSLLNDSNIETWTNEQLMDSANWALIQFASHTAPLVTQIYTDETIKFSGNIYEGVPRQTYDLSSDVTFPLDRESINSIEDEGSVYIKSGYNRDFLIGAQPSILRHMPGSSDTFEHINQTIVLAGPAGRGKELHINYFSYYDAIKSDVDILNIPKWSEPILAYLIAGLTLTSAIMQEVSISQFKESPESGNPEHNAHRKQQEFLIKRYELELKRFPYQDRANYFGDDVWQSQYR